MTLNIAICTLLSPTAASVLLLHNLRGKRSNGRELERVRSNEFTEKRVIDELRGLVPVHREVEPLLPLYGAAVDYLGHFSQFGLSFWGWKGKTDEERDVAQC